MGYMKVNYVVFSVFAGAVFHKEVCWTSHSSWANLSHVAEVLRHVAWVTDEPEESCPRVNHLPPAHVMNLCCTSAHRTQCFVLCPF